MLLGNERKASGFEVFVIIVVLLSALVFTAFDSYAWNEVELSSESLIYENLYTDLLNDTDLLNIDDHPKSMASLGSQSVSNVLVLNFSFPLFLFQILPYNKAFALRC